MNRRRGLVLSAAALLVLGTVRGARALEPLPPVTVYKSPACKCCGEWVSHLQASGFSAEAHDVADVSLIRRRYGVPEAMASCHTAVVGGYVIEGHVPASDIKRLLREMTKAAGLAVPGMVDGSPGMERGRPKPYATLVFDERGSRIFERH